MGVARSGSPPWGVPLRVCRIYRQLHLVDLAGSERIGKTGVGGQLLTEAKHINLSLHYLEQARGRRTAELGGLPL